MSVKVNEVQKKWKKNKILKKIYTFFIFYATMFMYKVKTRRIQKFMSSKFIKTYSYKEELNYEFLYNIYFDEWKEELEYSFYFIDKDSGGDETELLFAVSKSEFFEKANLLIKEVLLDAIVARAENKLYELDLDDKFKVSQTENGIAINLKQFDLNEKSWYPYRDLLDRVLEYVKTLK